ncbi:hypothetical protein A3C37_04155 [Candidatus Peribacteria bacterium RIFCSPHIGHO2_02_FULL_53_20]|nr:MAG: hypothetical protein A3C37_04155 [Candidatus Peribacteria bacterium RIFCSPHIGHO2_02_FULL_53_20]OGJ67543.1 MAG: hypothetical protein A3B61_04360 [Candidatus Peribacteria bacterium RIFCSPLOWO2_01_FULL_53_10]OGJ74788.1 MAG: hypothetical protein A3G69_03910 [Candidatus Peribacteria bacterium RIFCSPLOWO2_12_FULL_53_10]
MKHLPFHRSLPLFLSAVLATTGVLLFSTTASALHSWGSYHWARTSNPFTVKLGDNLSAAWDPYLATTSADWSVSAVLDTNIVTGQGRKNCRATNGRVEVCNAKYGNNGWLGIAQVWVSGTHITQGTVKVNDTYFNKPVYNTTAWKNLVLCQEVGHTFGLDHQDENFSNVNLGTCMDYSNDPTPNQHPNIHDYEQLEIIYAHLDTTTTLASNTAQTGQDIDVSDPPAWGKAIEHDSKGRPSKFERDLGNGRKVHTFVVWAD